MKTSILAWCIVAALLLAAFMASAISYAPEARTFGYALSTSLGVAAIFAIAVAVWIGCLPPIHYIHQSRLVNAICVVLAILIALLAAALG